MKSFIFTSILTAYPTGASIEDVKGQGEERRILSPLASKNLFKFTTPTKDRALLDQTSPYSLSPLSAKSQKLLRSPRKATRKISRIPFKVFFTEFSTWIYTCLNLNSLNLN